MTKPTITVFTPTYNRAYLLDELYQSLVAQTCRDFQWLLVDDGSTDDTRSLAQRYIQEKKLNVTYVYQENGGKHVAHNTGVKRCDTELFVCIDSDDSLYPDAIEKTLAFWESLREDPAVAGIVSPRDMGGYSRFVDPPEKSTLMALSNNGQLLGESMLVYRTSLLKEYLFPEIPGERFLTEGVVYYQIDQKYVLATQDDYLAKGAYLSDGLTANMDRIQWKNPRSTLLMHRVVAAYQTKPLLAAKAYGAYLAWKRIRKLEGWEEFPVSAATKAGGAMLYGFYFLKTLKMKYAIEKGE